MKPEGGQKQLLQHSLQTKWDAYAYHTPVIHLAHDEEVLPFDHAILDHGVNALSHLCLVLVDKRSIDVPVAGWDGCFHCLRHFAWGRLTGRDRDSYIRIQDINPLQFDFMPLFIFLKKNLYNYTFISFICIFVFFLL